VSIFSKDPSSRSPFTDDYWMKTESGRNFTVNALAHDLMKCVDQIKALQVRVDQMDVRINDRDAAIGDLQIKYKALVEKLKNKFTEIGYPPENNKASETGPS
jgi:hypothetical protein